MINPDRSDMDGFRFGAFEKLMDIQLVIIADSRGCKTFRVWLGICGPVESLAPKTKRDVVSVCIRGEC